MNWYSPCTKYIPNRVENSARWSISTIPSIMNSTNLLFFFKHTTTSLGFLLLFFFLFFSFFSTQQLTFAHKIKAISNVLHSQNNHETLYLIFWKPSGHKVQAFKMIMQPWVACMNVIHDANLPKIYTFPFAAFRHILTYKILSCSYWPTQVRILHS